VRLPRCRSAGGVVHTNHWLLDTSIAFHMAPAPATKPDWTSATVITALALLSATRAGYLLNRRDLKNA
jgi:polyether ionophore transport system permease protein